MDDFTQKKNCNSTETNWHGTEGNWKGLGRNFEHGYRPKLIRWFGWRKWVFFSYIFEAWLQRVLGEERLNGLKARVARDSSLMLFPHFLWTILFGLPNFLTRVTTVILVKRRPHCLVSFFHL